jgi:hypothetical protein
LFKNFLETHSNLFKDFKQVIFSEKNKKLLNSKKQDFLKIIDSYKVEAQELL